MCSSIFDFRLLPQHGSEGAMNNGMNSSTAVTNPSLQAAAKAAAQINAQLAAEGKFPNTLLNSPTNNTSAQKKQEANIKKAPKSGRKDLYSSEVEINHLPPRVRNLLTKGYIQEQLQWKSSMFKIYFSHTVT